jgi:PAS domain S-box-containing protein
MMTLSLERRIQIGFGIAVAIIVAVGAAALRSTAATVDSAGWVAHTLQVRGELEATFADLIDAETGVRGYVITGDTTYLAPYDTARATLGGLVGGLRTLTADNPAQQRRLDSLETLVGTRLERFRWTINTRRTEGPAAAGRAVIGGQGKELMQRIRGVVTRMEDEEGRLLAQRSASLHARADQARVAVVGGTVLALVLALITSVLVGRELAGRRVAERALRESEGRLTQLLEALPFGVFVVDAQGRPSYVNKTAQAILGKGIVPGTAAGDLPEVYQAYVPGTDQVYPADRQPIVLALRGEPAHAVVIEIRRPDRTVPIEVWAAPVVDSQGRVTHAVAAFSDISERERARQALRESEERYRLLFESNPLPAWVFDLETLRFLAVNDAAVRDYGYTRDEFLTMTIADIRPPEDVPALRATVARIGPGHSGAGVWRHKKKDGTLIQVEVTSHEVRYGERRGELVLAQDVTQRAGAEAALRASEERFRLLVGNVRDYAIYMLDPTGRVASWNGGAEQIKGYRADEIVGQHFARFFTPEDVAAGRPDAILRAAATQGRYEEENWRVRKDGSRFWADVVITAVRDEAGALRGFAKVTRDLTERQRAEAALRASEERFRILAVTANDAILSADREGRITYFNPGAERIFGFAAAEVSGKPLSTLMPERFIAAHRAGFARYLATREARVVGKTVELAGRKKDGTEFPLELSLASWTHGAEIAFTAIVRDITARKQGEAELQRYAAQLEAANKELEAFSYSVSHDLRAPLRSIDGFSQALLEDYADRLDAAGQDYLQRVRAATQRMGALIDDLINLSRLTRSEMQIDAVDLSALATGIAAELARDDPKRQVEFAITPGLVARADGGLIRVVLHNLLANAWKFTSGRPHAVIEFGTAAQDGGTTYFVRDNGAGFDMAYAAKLFGAFQRLHGVAEFPGTGIGLATVQRIIHRHGGRVWAEAAPDRGATFYFTL